MTLLPLPSPYGASPAWLLSLKQSISLALVLSRSSPGLPTRTLVLRILLHHTLWFPVYVPVSSICIIPASADPVIQWGIWWQQILCCPGHYVTYSTHARTITMADNWTVYSPVAMYNILLRKIRCPSPETSNNVLFAIVGVAVSQSPLRCTDIHWWLLFSDNDIYQCLIEWWGRG